MIKVVLHLTMLMLLGVTSNYADAQPNVEWSRTYQALGKADVTAILPTADGGCFTVGAIQKSGSDANDGFVSRVGQDGTLLWTTILGGSLKEGFLGVSVAPDGGIIAVGSTASYDGDIVGSHGGWDAWVVRLSPNGSVIWNKTYGGSGADEAVAIAPSGNGNWVIAGYTNSSDGDVTKKKYSAAVWVFSIDEMGKLLWQTAYGNDSGEILPSAIVPTYDNGYAIAAVASAEGGDIPAVHHNGIFAQSDYWILKLDSTGLLQWSSCFGGTKGETPFGIVQSVDSGLTVVGYAESTDGDVTGRFPDGGAGDVWLVHISNNGKLLWQKCYGGSSGDGGIALIYTRDRGYVIAAITYSNDFQVTGQHGPPGLNRDFWLLKTDSVGILQWENCYGGSGDDNVSGFCQSGDDGYIAAGYSNSKDGNLSNSPAKDVYDPWVIKFNGLPCSDIRVALDAPKLSVRAGDTVHIPVVALDTSTRPVTVLNLTLSLNTDLLAPLRVEQASGTFASVVASKFTVFPDSVQLELRLSHFATLQPGKICELICEAQIAKTASTPIELKSVMFSDPPFSNTCLASVIGNGQQSTSNFSLVQECGDPTISSFMSTTLLAVAGNVTPNPASQTATLNLQAQKDSRIDLDILDLLGRPVYHESVLGTGERMKLPLDLCQVAEGVYVVRATVRSGEAKQQLSRRMVVSRAR